jgi:hypothetical protein
MGAPSPVIRQHDLAVSSDLLRASAIVVAHPGHELRVFIGWSVIGRCTSV